MTTSTSSTATIRRRVVALGTVGGLLLALAAPALAQRVTKPSEPPPPAPPPPATQPRSGVVEPPKPSATKPSASPQTPTKPATPQSQTELLRLAFDLHSATLSEAARASLDKLATSLKGEPSKRLLLKAYTSTGTSVSETRRLSLQRGLAVRGYLGDKGIAANRIDVQPLGNADDGGPGDRVDVLPGRP